MAEVGADGCCDQADPSEKSKCLVCKEEISKGAVKCIHCDTFQDWRRYLSISSSVLALFVALVSVLSLSIPVFKDLVVSNKSDVSLTFQNAENGYAYFVASNGGGKPGSVADARFVYENSSEESPYIFKLNNNNFGGFVSPGASVQIKYSLPNEAAYGKLMLAIEEEDYNYKLDEHMDAPPPVGQRIGSIIVKIIQFDGSYKIASTPIDFRCFYQIKILRCQFIYHSDDNMLTMY